MASVLKCKEEKVFYFYFNISKTIVKTFVIKLKNPMQ